MENKANKKTIEKMILKSNTNKNKQRKGKKNQNE